MFRRISIDISMWLALWCGSWGIFYVMLSKGINYISRPIFTAVYFSLATLLVIGLYRDILRKTGSRLKSISWPVPSLSLGCGVAVYLIIPLLLFPPHKLILQHPDMFFLHLDLKYLFAKLFDISFQQTLMVMLIVLLVNRGLSLKRISLICLTLFGSAHLYLLGGNGWVLGGLFVAFSMLAGWIFPPLIMRHKNGIAYTFSLHWMFYVVTGTMCWLCPSVFAY